MPGVNLPMTDKEGKPVIHYYWVDLHGNKRARCPRRPIMENPVWWSRVVAAYNHYNQGFLPHPGAINEQACLFPQIMHVMEWGFEKASEIRRKQLEGKSSESQ